MSTGAILLADIIPSFIIKILSPFFPYNANLRVFVSCLLSITSFVSVGFATSREIVITGVILTSFASGLGEPTFLAHSTLYHKNVVSTWSSGTGGAGIIGSLSYSLLREIGLNSKQTLLLMLFVPTIEFFTFFFLLSKPNRPRQERETDENSSLLDREPEESHEGPDEAPLNTIARKLAFVPKLMIYFLPLSFVYFFEYFINQGLVSVIYWDIYGYPSKGLWTIPYKFFEILNKVSLTESSSFLLFDTLRTSK
jgi:battenin